MSDKKQLASTPPMGLNTWDQFGDKVCAEDVCGVADAISSNGLKELGYEYVVVDDCWSVKGQRDKNGDLIPDPERFPDGIKSVADYVHGKGLKFGIYSDAAEMTCAGFPGSFGFEQQDVALWAKWGVDFLKYDYCHAPQEQAAAMERYARMGQALQNCGREILFSLCEWGFQKPWLWGREAGGQMWRVTGDIIDSWTNVSNSDWTGIGIEVGLEQALNLHEYAGPGGWNDLDMLVVGLNGKGSVMGEGCSHHEYRTQVSMWSILCSPLMIGCDVRTMSKETSALLMNPEILAINQDPLGEQARRLIQRNGIELWRKRLCDGGVALALLNRGSSAQELRFSAGDIGLLDGHKSVVRDCWKNLDVSDFKPELAFTVQPHDTKVLKIDK